MRQLCTKCGRMKEIVFRFEAEINGRKVEKRLCRACFLKNTRPQPPTPKQQK